MLWTCLAYVYVDKSGGLDAGTGVTVNALLPAAEKFPQDSINVASNRASRASKSQIFLNPSL